MTEKIYTLEEISEKVNKIAKDFGVKKVYLFGSYARGEADSSSDLDFRVDKGKVRGFGFGGLCNAFEDTFDKPVDVVTTASLDKSFLEAIQSEEVLLYEAN